LGLEKDIAMRACGGVDVGREGFTEIVGLVLGVL